ncbi:Pentatricopeptide repeat-containing protein At2g15690 family [Sesbania bispinosa]|nr:Pentatricopeptide repeat-containing protein At2g15690 family [Sesbania bispinosa]
MELILHASLVSLPRTGNSIFSSHLNFANPSPSSSTTFCNYALPDASKLHTRRNGTNHSRFTHKTLPLRKGNTNSSIEPKLTLEQRVNQNQNSPLSGSSSNVDLAALCKEGKLNQVLELMGQGAVAGYSIYHALLNLYRAEEFLAGLDPSKAIADKLPIPPRKKQSAINMLEVKNRVTEYRYSIPYKEEADEKLKGSNP